MKTLKTYLWRDEQFLLGKLMTFRKGLETKVYLFLEKKKGLLFILIEKWVFLGGKVLISRKVNLENKSIFIRKELGFWENGFHGFIEKQGFSSFFKIEKIWWEVSMHQGGWAPIVATLAPLVSCGDRVLWKRV